MKTAYSKEGTYILILAKGEEFTESLIGFCRENGISAGTFSAIGACDEVLLSWYNLKDKKYEDHQYGEGLEMTNITGNIGKLDGNHIVHAHGTFARRDLSVIAGHIKKMIVSATCEVVLNAYPTSLARSYDAGTGLNLII